ncbi:MAG: recombinase family protein [Alphaproteobacteria bacterium]|nr:recombinase family protein [Alphaproteobacteria bacterium]
MSAPPKLVRCAIYTRKSTEEGLDQAFNSLDAQREACEAYIQSQRHEGWRAVSKAYDDGGYSGGSLERPALATLLGDIKAGQVGMVVVYKIDRLTRSLADFSKLIETLDAAGCSFVSVTQAFNTSSSMGRLTLNVLLSFAQFEREVTAERIRDKITASKKKGMWMGGMVPLGYDRDGNNDQRRLTINAAEAKSVEFLFSAYDETPCLSAVCDAAREAGILSKPRQFKSGATYGGKPLRRGQVHFILTNPIYAGKVRHRDKVYPGQHEAVIDPDLFDRVQDKLVINGRKPRGTVSASGRTRSPLSGRVVDTNGSRLTPTHTRGKSGKAHRYYVSTTSREATAHGSGWRLPASALEEAVGQATKSHLTTAGARLTLLQDAASTTQDQAADIGASLASLSTAELCLLVDKVTIASGHLDILLDKAALAERFNLPLDQVNEEALTMTKPFATRRRGVETRIVAGNMMPSPDATLISTLAKAHRWIAQMKTGVSAATIAKSEKTSDAFIRVRANLAFLSPRIQEQILAGTQPADLSLERLVRSEIPLDWDQQERKFGFR